MSRGGTDISGSRLCGDGVEEGDVHGTGDGVGC